MTCAKSAVAPDAFNLSTDERGASALRAYLRCSLAVAEMEFRKLRHDPTELLARAIQPVLWLGVFGQVMARLRAVPTGRTSYLAFMTPGILAQSLMFISIFYGLSIIMDRDQGILQKFLVLPVPRAAFVTGKGFGAGVRALVQGVAVLLLASLMGVHLRWSLVGILGSLVTVVLGASLFSTLSLLIAIVVKTRERFMGIGQMITMPLFFASNAIYPISVMPHWLRVLSSVNPLSYVVDLLRGYLVSGQVASPTVDWVILLLMLALAQFIAGRTYHRVMG